MLDGSDGPRGKVLALLGLSAAALCLGTIWLLLSLVLVNRTPPQATLATQINQATSPPTRLAALPTATLTTTPLPTPIPSSTPTPAEPSPTTVTPAAPESQPAAACPPPDGWEAYQVEPGDTLFAFVLGAGGTVSTNDLRSANCLTSDLLQVGQTLYLPPGAAENAPSSDPVGVPAAVSAAPRTPACSPCVITIQPGWRAEQIAAAIDNTPVAFWGADFLAAVGPGAAVPAHEFLSSRPAGASLEGFLFPSTYELTNEHTAESFRDMLLAAFGANLPGDAASAAAARGLSLYQTLIIASIVQRESRVYAEQVLVSSVFHNRLRGNMPLGASVTLQYALGVPGDWWPRLRGSQIGIDSPYNTNVDSGLPPSPICNAAADAIRAALYPAETTYLFYNGNCNGPGNLYANTYEEHLANVRACS
jgi:UPF0755 protein